MLGQEGEERNIPVATRNRKTYLRSVSWSDRSPSGHTPKPLPNTHTNGSKVRSSLPPLQPLSISRRNIEEWPRPGSDDLGEWPHPPSTPGSRSVKPLYNSDSEHPPREFQLKKDKLAFFDKECSRIADHIYLGSDAVAKNREILRQNGITHVLNCVGFVCPEYFKSDLVYKTLWLQDSPSEDITSILYDVFDYFEDVREQGGRVFVHCCQGVSRSTSLVIAYLMWRDGQSFEDAFQYVKAARGVTNPNMGFACQLLQCQKRVHAVPVSPTSVLRMYRMAPHSPYDPLHLVPKMLSYPGPLGLDSRGAFVVHVPSAIYVWTGKNCTQVMSNCARVAACQVVRYERAQGPILRIDEGEEPADFWDALASAPLLSDDLDKVAGKLECSVGKDQVAAAIRLGVGGKKVDEYDLDYEIFQKALSGGVVPPFSLSATGSETHLPARENGWDRLRRKLASGLMKELVISSKLTSNNSSQSGDTPDKIIGTTLQEMRNSPVSPAVSSPPPSPSCGSPGSFYCHSNASSKPNSRSPSPAPSPSDSSSSFTFSPASSNWSDFSFLSSSQPSPSAMEIQETFAHNSPQAEKAFFPFKETYPSLGGAFDAEHALRVEKACFPHKGACPSLAERRGSNPPALVLTSSTDNPTRLSKYLVRSRSFSLPDLEEDVTRDSGCNQLKSEAFYEINRGEQTSNFEQSVSHNKVQYRVEDEKEFDNVLLASCAATGGKVSELKQPALFHWPTMEKVEMQSPGVLDSKSVFLLLAPDVNLERSKPKILYIWVGHNASFDKEQIPLISSYDANEDSHIHWEKVGRYFLNQMDLLLDLPIQVFHSTPGSMYVLIL
uniref:Protein-tyrosine-phosphatase MKP1-like n=1 Tax=Nelumbo nucifera TaxID=4432 RepID=A0A822YYU3_NELNU|nr:TPA_asm: hypothetical protein HUJ06_005058 [Nelumbo nucifera]